MVMSTTNGAPALSPEQIHELLVTPVENAATATDSAVSTIVRTTSRTWRIPIVGEDPAASWVAEGQEISPSDAELAEVEVVPAKVAGLTIITRELAEDTSPEAAEIVGAGLARDIGRKVDQAFFGALAAPAPPGLGTINPTEVVGGELTDLGAFSQATSAVEQLGTEVTAWVANPSTALRLSDLREADGSNRGLLALDPAQPSRRLVEGRPVLVSPYVEDGVVWGLPADRTFVIIRSDATVETDTSVFFTSDRVAVKGTMRVGFGFPHPDAVVRIEFETA